MDNRGVVLYCPWCNAEHLDL